MMVLQTVKWQPMHGYALVQHLKTRSKDLLQVEEIDQAIKCLGHVRASPPTSASNAAAAKPYLPSRWHLGTGPPRAGPAARPAPSAHIVEEP